MLLLKNIFVFLFGCLIPTGIVYYLSEYNRKRYPGNTGNYAIIYMIGIGIFIVLLFLFI